MAGNPRTLGLAPCPIKRRRSGPKSKSSPFLGVTQYKRTGRYEAHIWIVEMRGAKGHQRHLGSYNSAEAAARCYDRAALRLRGPTAELNFPVEDYALDAFMNTHSKVDRHRFLDLLRAEFAIQADRPAGGGAGRRRPAAQGPSSPLGTDGGVRGAGMGVGGAERTGPAEARRRVMCVSHTDADAGAGRGAEAGARLRGDDSQAPLPGPAIGWEGGWWASSSQPSLHPDCPEDWYGEEGEAAGVVERYAADCERYIADSDPPPHAGPWHDGAGGAACSAGYGTGYAAALGRAHAPLIQRSRTMPAILPSSVIGSGVVFLSGGTRGMGGVLVGTPLNDMAWVPLDATHDEAASPLLMLDDGALCAAWEGGALY